MWKVLVHCRVLYWDLKGIYSAHERCIRFTVTLFTLIHPHKVIINTRCLKHHFLKWHTLFMWYVLVCYVSKNHILSFLPSFSWWACFLHIIYRLWITTTYLFSQFLSSLFALVGEFSLNCSMHVLGCEYYNNHISLFSFFHVYGL